MRNIEFKLNIRSPQGLVTMYTKRRGGWECLSMARHNYVTILVVNTV